jgi:hypothetical protein
MKILPVVLLLLIGFFFIQKSAAQDSSNYIPPVHKKTSKRHHAKTDSTVQMVVDSSIVKATTNQGTTIAVVVPAKKSTKHKLASNDSTDVDLRYFHSSSPRIVRIPKSPIRPKFPTLDSIMEFQFVVDPIAASYSDSLKAVVKDSLFIVDSLKTIANVFADSVYKDSVTRHWIGWKKYQVRPNDSYTLFSKRVLKGKSKTELQYNIADFYLYLNGEIVKPDKTGNIFFAAGCLSFKYDDTLLLNSGLGFKVGVGVGIKIYQGRFTGSMHANTHNQEVYKLSKEDTSYLKSVIAEPITQSLKLQSVPAYAADEVIIGEYRATYKAFYQKNENDEDEERQYTVKIIFRCRISGGIDSIKSLGGASSK